MTSVGLSCMILQHGHLIVEQEAEVPAFLVLSLHSLSSLAGFSFGIHIPHSF